MGLPTSYPFLLNDEFLKSYSHCFMLATHGGGLQLLMDTFNLMVTKMTLVKVIEQNIF